MSGNLALTTPWARGAFPDWDERRSYERRIRDGYVVLLGARKSRSDWTCHVVQVGATKADNRTVWDTYDWRDPRRALEAAIKWIDTHDLAVYDGVEVPVR